MINIRRFQYKTEYENFLNSSEYKECSLVKIGTPGINDASTTVKYREQPESMTLVRHWDGTTNLSSSKWNDKVASQYWTMTGSPTHGTGYYEFANTNPAAKSKYGTLNGNLPDLGYHWKIVADIAFYMRSSNPTTFVAFDFGSITSVSDGKCAVSCGLLASSGKYDFNPKFNGNGSAPTYKPAVASMAAETIANNNTWLRRTIIFGVRSSNISGKDEMYVYVPECGEAVTSTPFTPLRFNRWESGKSFMARSTIDPSSTYPYSTYCRIYDIKVYGTA